MFLTKKSSSSRLSKIGAGMNASFQALPRNAEGRLSAQGLRYLVYAYFAQEHGWLIRGLGTHDHQDQIALEMHNADILKRAPEILEALMDARHSRQGFTLQDAIAMTA